MLEMLLPDRVSRPRAWRICSAVIAGAAEALAAGAGGVQALAEVAQARGELGTVGGLVGKHPDAAGLGQGAGLPVQNLPGCGHPGVPNQRAGQVRRLGASGSSSSAPRPTGVSVTL